MSLKPKMPLLLTIISCVLIAVAVLANIVVFAGTEAADTFLQFSLVFSVAAALSSITYLFGGASKKEAEYYRVFALFFALAEFFVVMDVGGGDATRLEAGLCSLCFGFVLTIGLSKNLGKIISLALCIAIAGIRLYSVINAFLLGGSILDASPLRAIGAFATALVLLLCTVAKYIDKAKRGSK